MSSTNSKHKREHEAAVIKKVSRRQDSEGHGGAWKVAFADFVLALMCLFLVLWVLAARDQESLQQLLTAGGGSPLQQGSSKVIDHTGTPRGSLIPREPIPGQSGSEARTNSPVRDSDHSSSVQNDSSNRPRKSLDSTADLQKLANVLAEMSNKAGLSSNVQTVITPYGLRVMLHDTDNQGMFERGSAILEPSFKQLLNQIGGMLGEIDNQLLLVGHTDAAQYRSPAAGFTNMSNWALSTNRAMSARVHLLQGGLGGNSVLQVVGMADRAPLDKARPLASINRRIEMLILTSGQAQAVVAMFGNQERATTVTPGVATALPDQKVLEQLRSDSMPNK